MFSDENNKKNFKIYLMVLILTVNTLCVLLINLCNGLFFPNNQNFEYVFMFQDNLNFAYTISVLITCIFLVNTDFLFKNSVLLIIGSLIVAVMLSESLRLYLNVGSLRLVKSEVKELYIKQTTINEDKCEIIFRDDSLMTCDKLIKKINISAKELYMYLSDKNRSPIHLSNNRYSYVYAPFDKIITKYEIAYNAANYDKNNANFNEAYYFQKHYNPVYMDMNKKFEILEIFLENK